MNIFKLAKENKALRETVEWLDRSWRDIIYERNALLEENAELRRLQSQSGAVQAENTALREIIKELNDANCMALADANKRLRNENDALQKRLAELEHSPVDVERQEEGA